ncbi:MAG: hypothetical protein WDN00_01490 [Limisphaerales bacterium]
MMKKRYARLILQARSEKPAGKNLTTAKYAKYSTIKSAVGVQALAWVADGQAEAFRKNEKCHSKGALVLVRRDYEDMRL